MCKSSISLEFRKKKKKEIEGEEIIKEIRQKIF